MAYAGSGRRRAASLALAIEILLAGLALGAGLARRDPLGADYVHIEDVAARPSDLGTGSYTWDCGRNEIGHRNTANVVVTPGRAGPSHHVHDYIGNLSVDVGSTVRSLAGGGTTCGNGDESSYYWPVLRTVGADGAQHGGAVQVPVSLTLTYYGNARGPVVEMPRLLRGAVGDAYAFTNGGARAAPVWSCSGSPDRWSARYVICPDSERVLRVFDFPSCWDGRRADSSDHRRHLVFPAPGGGCPISTFAVPHLRIVVAYDIAKGTRYRIDSFEAQRHSPLTDHAFFVNLMPSALMREIVRCLNAGRVCQ
ncbi:DUF1996 domain-containing protein [Amorphoplanes digitatis]|uniref:DUF1996 domain-containing protein n=1 Tax=Actinoplanes digitatis TaxID=1868 RepID=A0A7W7I629_9ACTN|nr:DUF1996 domain-containing protein [Actinoplanes digitatis]MBB4766848.1 hypothetical protein [Actinoplanes digitatis]GID96448.1 hypothetical protein Adi01nite_58600 [Actinoplanes digitatis]